MPPSGLTAILTKIVTSTAGTVIKREAEKLLLTPPFETACNKAIAKTAQAFPDVEVAAPLRSWLSGEGFRGVIARLEAGEGSPGDPTVLRSFIDEGGFYLAQRTDEVAAQVVGKFLSLLRDELCQTEEGLAIAAKRQEFVIKQEGEAIRGHVTAEFAQWKAEIQRLIPDSSRGTQETREAVLNARIDGARDLLREGKPLSARSVLDRLRAELEGQSISQSVTYRIATNMGACALQCGDSSAAAVEFQRALDAEPDNPKALANAALGTYLTGNATAALQMVARARVIEPKDPHAASIHLEVLYAARPYAETAELLKAEPWIEEDPMCCLVLGEISYRSSEYARSEAFLRRARSFEKTPNPETLHLLGLAIIAQVEDPDVRRPIPLAWRAKRGVDVAARLDEAEKALTEAIAILEKREIPKRLAAALVNRSGVRAMGARFVDALADCDRALAIEPSEPVALHNRPLFLLALDRSTEAVEAFRKRPNLSASAVASFAAAYMRTDQPLAAIELLEPYWIFGSEDDQLQAAEMLLWAYHEAHRADRCVEVITALANTWPTDPRALRVIAAHHTRGGNSSQAIGLLREALAYAAGPYRELILVELADALAAEKEYGEAASLYSQVADVTSSNPLTIRYLKCLYNAGDLGRALEISKRVRGDGPPVPIVGEVEARVLEDTDELPAACDLRVALAKVEPANVAHRLAVARIEYRRGRTADAEAAINSIGLHEVRGDAFRLMQVAQLRTHLKMPGALQFAYEARRVGFRSPEIHLAFIGLFLNREKAQDDALHKAAVEVDCTVDLRDEQGGSRVFTICDDPDLSKGEIAAGDELAKKLMGHQVHERVILKEGPLEELVYEVTNVRSKFVAAFQESILNFSTWFSDHEGLHRITVRDDDYSKIFFSVDQRDALARQIRNLYLRGALTLGTMACLMGTTRFSVWSGLAGEEDGRLLTSSGNGAEIEEALDALSAAQAIVIDATALFTFKHLGIEEKVVMRFPTAIVAQGVLDEIRESTEEEARRKGGGSIGKAGDRYVMQEFPDAFVEARISFLTEIRDFIAAKTRIVGAAAAIDLGPARLEEMEQLLGAGAVASIYAARDGRAVLVADDLNLRLVARNDWRLSVVGSQAFLILLRKEGLITDDDYHRYIAALAVANYHFISFDAPTLVWAIESEQARLSPAVVALMKGLQGPECTEESAVRVVADTMRSVWLTPGMLDRKLLVLDLALNALAKGRSADVILDRLKRALRVRFALAPLPLPTILRSIDLWEQRFLLERGLARP